MYKLHHIYLADSTKKNSREVSYNERTASVVLVLKSRNCLPRRVYPLMIDPLETNILSRDWPDGPPSSILVMTELDNVLNTDYTQTKLQVLSQTLTVTGSSRVSKLHV